MIHGSDVNVEPASSENGYVELSAEAANNPWSQIAAGRELKGKLNPQRVRKINQNFRFPDSPVKKLDGNKHRHKIVSYGDPDF